MRCLNLSKTIEMRPHLLKRGRQDTFIRLVSVVLGIVVLVLVLIGRVLQDLRLERRLNHPEQLVLLLLKAILPLLLRTIG